jgi:DNA polymerase IV
MRNIDYINTARPLVMHIDLNSCFATVEQQAHPTLRGRPVVIVNRRTEHTSIITASYEAKACGVGLGMNIVEARKLCPGLVALESDPAKYRHVYHKLLDIMNDYSSHVRMKSIDEGVIDFSESSLDISGRDLKDVGREIKQRLRNEIGCAIRCNVGIASNRFLAKTAAGLHKPDGLDEINADNLKSILSDLKLTDLTGIAYRMQKRLNAVGIYTPTEFFEADSMTLEKMVFKSICGREWYQRLRGWEVDKRDFPLRTAGRQYVLEDYKLPRELVIQRLHHLCEEVGFKIRSKNLVARGVYVYAKGYDRSRWQARHMASLPFFSDQAIYSLVSKMFENAPLEVKEIGVTCYELSHDDNSQLSLFGDELAKTGRLTSAVDEINNRYGRRVIHSADTLETNSFVKQKIPFGSTRYL